MTTPISLKNFAYPFAMARNNPGEFQSAQTSPEYHTFIEHFSELVSTLRNTDLYQYFVSKYVITLSDLEEINSASTPKDKIQVLLRKISSPLEAGYKKSFYEMLEIMKCHGNDATRTLSVSISSSLSMVHSDITGTHDNSVSPSNEIQIIDDLSVEFGAVVSDIAEELEQCVQKKLEKLKLVCYHLTDGRNKLILSHYEKDQIKHSKTVYDIFEVVSPHWRWNSHRLLVTIIKRVKSPRALEMLERFKKKIDYKSKLKSVHDLLEGRNEPFPPGYCKMVAIVDKDYSEITLEEVSELENFVEEYLGVRGFSEVHPSNSVCVLWHVPVAAVKSLCTKARQHKDGFILESFLYLKIGDVIVFDIRQNSSERKLSNEVLMQELLTMEKSALRTAEQSAGLSKIIDTYTNILMENLNFDLVAPVMISKELLSEEEFTVIASDPCDYIKNSHLLEYVRVMDASGIFQFCLVLQEADNEMTYNIGNSIQRVLESHQSKEKESVELQPESAIAKASSDQKDYSHIPFSHFISPVVAFLHLLGILNNLLQSVHPSVLVSKCSELLISETHKISLFSTDELNMLNRYSQTSMLMKILRVHWTWYDHSILKTLLEVSNVHNAMKLLEDFESHIDYTLPVTNYPIPTVNHLMIPSRSSKYTVLATTYDCDTTIRYLTLQCVTDLKLKMISSFGITEHSVQLLAVNHTPAIFYWMIPKVVVPLVSIRSTVQKHLNMLKSSGIIEVAIYPNSMFVMDHDLTVGPLSYLYSQPSAARTRKMVTVSSSEETSEETVEQQLMEDSTEVSHDHSKLSLMLQHVHKQKNTLLKEKVELNQIIEELRRGLENNQQQCKELTDKLKEIDKGENLNDLLKRCTDCKFDLEKTIKITTTDTDLPDPVKLGEDVAKNATLLDKLKNEVDNIQVLIKHLQLCGTKNKDLTKQQQNEIDELASKLTVRDNQLTKLKEENKHLLKKVSGSKELIMSAKLESDEISYPVQYEALGSGNYGSVYKVYYKSSWYSGKVVHEKILPGYPKHDGAKLAKQFAIKCATYINFSHANVEQFIEVVLSSADGIPMIISELLPENLTNYISRTAASFHYNLQLSVCQDMAQGLNYLHSQSIIHGNLHGANVLMTNDQHAKIGDYLSPLLLDDVAVSDSLGYLPPEAAKGKKLSNQSNVFSLGVLFLQVVTKHPPQLKGDSVSEIERRASEFGDVHKNHPLLPLIQICLEKDEATRPLSKEVCTHIDELVKEKDGARVMAFKLLYTTEYQPILPALASRKHQLDYVPCQNLPVPMNWAYAVTIGTIIYVTGGNSRTGDPIEHTYTFDVEKNEWDKLPPSGYHYCVPVIVEGKLSLIGGRKPQNKVPVARVDTYDESRSQWMSIYPDMKHPRYRPAVVATDHYVIALGGKLKEPKPLTNTIEVMNIPSKQWISVATRLPLNLKLYDITATISRDLVWIVGYDDGNLCYNKVFTVPVSDVTMKPKVAASWSSVRNDAVCYKAAVVPNSDPPVLLGGDDRSNTAVSTVIAFDPKTDSWNEVASLSSPRAHCTVANLPGNCAILVVGGCTETRNLNETNSTSLKTTELYYVSNKH